MLRYKTERDRLLMVAVGNTTSRLERARQREREADRGDGVDVGDKDKEIVLGEEEADSTI